MYTISSSEPSINPDVMIKIEKTLCFRLMKVRRHVVEETKAEFTAQDFTFDNYVLLVVVGDHDGLSQSNLARRLGKDKNVVARLVDKFEGMGLIERRPAGDRRTKALHLTEKGRLVVTSQQRCVLEGEKRVTSVLTPEERATLVSLLDKVLRGRADPDDGNDDANDTIDTTASGTKK